MLRSPPVLWGVDLRTLLPVWHESRRYKARSIVKPLDATDSAPCADIMTLEPAFNLLELDLPCPVPVDDLDLPRPQVDDESRLELVDAPLQQLESLLQAHVGAVVPVHRRQAEEGAVPVRGVRHRRERAEVVDPVERGRRRGEVVPPEEEVDLVGLARPQRLGELVSDPCGGGLGAKLDVMSVWWSGVAAAYRVWID